jgi:Rha family phage regulatory protein
MTVGSLGGELSKLAHEAATMATIPTQTQPEVTIIDGHAVTTSIAIADYFTKRHDDVLKKIRALECSPEFNARNFAEVEYTDAKGEKRPAYQITRDGFAFLGMGFTGKRAAAFKENYITAFNHMEMQLQASGNDLSSIAHNAAVSARYLQIINQAWRESLYPMLVAAKSPLAVELHDRIQDAGFISALVAKSLGRLS